MARQKQFAVNESSKEHVNEAESRRPDNTAFKQQRLTAWQPRLSPRSVLPLFIITGLLFIPLGAVFLMASNSVFETQQDYTNCVDSSGADCSTYVASTTCVCTLTFNFEEDVDGPVYVYYGLSNFFQNHRRYVKSRDDRQLIGEAVDENSISNDCAPYRLDSDGKPIAPCGAIANSLFNDTFTLKDSSSTEIEIDNTGIAWTSDHDVKFNNPEPRDNLDKAFEGTGQPLFWSRNITQLDPSNPSNNGYKNEALEVWMRTAAFPTFRKLYGRIDGGIKQGEYQVTVNYNYPVVSYDGTKKIVFSTVSWLGGKNIFIGVAYIVVGALSLLTGLVLLIVNKTRKEK